VIKKVLICGASGFIGRNLLEHLSKNPGLAVYGTYFNSYKSDPCPYLSKVDFTDRNASAQIVANGFDCVINAAAITDGSIAINNDPAKYIAGNVSINNNIIETVHANRVKQFIFLSCSILYPAHNLAPVKENEIDSSKIHPAYRYWAEVKIFFEEMCRFYSGIDSTDWTIIRHSNIYGPHDKFDPNKGHVFAATVAKITDKKNNIVAVSGNGFEKRDFLHVFDLAKAIELAITVPLSKYEILNIGSGTLISIRELVEKIKNISGQNIPIIYDGSKPTTDTSIALDTTKAEKILGWNPDIDIDEGIRQTINWHKKRSGE